MYGEMFCIINSFCSLLNIAVLYENMRIIKFKLQTPMYKGMRSINKLLFSPIFTFSNKISVCYCRILKSPTNPLKMTGLTLVNQLEVTYSSAGLWLEKDKNTTIWCLGTWAVTRLIHVNDLFKAKACVIHSPFDNSNTNCLWHNLRLHI